MEATSYFDNPGNVMTLTMNREMAYRILYAISTSNDPKIKDLRERIFYLIDPKSVDYNEWIDAYEAKLYGGGN